MQLYHFTYEIDRYESTAHYEVCRTKYSWAFYIKEVTSQQS